MPVPSEEHFVKWLRGRPETRGFVGDDAALLPRGGPWVVTVDSQRAGVHFHPDLDPAIFARRLLAVNLSDLAASGALPAYAFLAMGIPGSFDLKRFFRAFLRQCDRNRITLAGGDMARDERPNACLTLLGRIPEEGQWLRRDASRPGDAIWVGGTLGQSALGCRLSTLGVRLWGNRPSLPPDLELPKVLHRPAKRALRRHLLPLPQLALGQWLGLQARAAAIDLSDGLARDLKRLCQSASVGAEIDWSALPTSDKFEPLAAALRCVPRDLVLGGGEDYVLLFTLPPSVLPPARFACHRIGRVTRKRGLNLLEGGRRTVLPDTGWDHLGPASASGSC